MNHVPACNEATTKLQSTTLHPHSCTRHLLQQAQQCNPNVNILYLLFSAMQCSLSSHCPTTTRNYILLSLVIDHPDLQCLPVC